MNLGPSDTPSQFHQQTQLDEHYTYGRPVSTYLPFRAIVRLTILRSKLEAIRHERATRRRSLNERAA